VSVDDMSPRASNASDGAGGSETSTRVSNRSLLRKRLLYGLLALAVAALALGLFVGWLLQPKQLVPLILDRAGKALGLEMTADADAEARLRGEPQLIVRKLIVREPGTTAPLLSAERLLIALPWSTLRSRGEDLTIRRIELDAPQLDLIALQRWLAERPPTEETLEVPTLIDGLYVRHGRIENHDWTVDHIHIDLPALRPRHEVRARIRGRYLDAPTRIPFDFAVAMTRPANGAGLAVVGPLSIERGDWRLPSTVTLSGPLRIGEDDLRMAPATFGMVARYESGDTRVPFTLGLHGPLHFDEATWALEPVTAILRGEGAASSRAMPNLDARGALALGRRLVLRLDGTLPAWPEAWPALPAPISDSSSPLPFRLRYAGAPELSEIIELGIARDAVRFDSRFRLNDVLTWLAQSDGSPLPPLDGRLTAPKLEISGATLEGVEIDVDDEDVR
jgi:hypothetical protein